jgi:acyl-CoA thioesterase
MTNDQKRFDNIEKYLKQNFHSYFIREVNMNIDTLFADVYTDNGTNLVKQQVAAFKRGTNAIEHKVIT